MKLGTSFRGRVSPARLLAVAAVLLPLLLLGAFAQRGAQQERARRAAGAGEKTVLVRAGDDLQKALDAARPGDTVVLEAGATFRGTITLPNKGAGDSYITVRSSRLAELPAGVRVTPAQGALMPKIVAPGRGEPAIRTAPGAHHYRLLGIEFAQPTKDEFCHDLVKLGEGAAGVQDVLAEVPHHLTLDRCYVHAAADGELKRGIALNSADTEIANCHVSGFKVRGQESQAVGGWNTPGRIRIVNNYLEGAGENIMFGGALPSIPNLIPTDIEILRNHLFKPPAWRGVYTVKNLLELKTGKRVRINGNILENNWADAQVGFAVLFTVRTSDSGDAATLEDIEFTNNVVRHVAAGVSVLGRDDVKVGLQGRRLTISNNLFEDISNAYGNNGRLLQVVNFPELTFERNTAAPPHSFLLLDGTPAQGLVFRHNLVAYGEYGAFGNEVGSGRRAFETYAPGAVFERNLIYGNTEYAHLYPGNNKFVAVAPSAAPAGIGCDRAQIQRAMAHDSTPAP